MKLVKIGELAKAVGITVRSLRHYDQIGLLQPTMGRESGHRLYGRQDVERLQQVLSLKSMGFSLQEIQRCLDEEAYDLRKTLNMQKKAVVAHIENWQRIHQTLHLMLERLGQDQTVTTQELVLFMKELEEMESLYTKEQAKKLRDRYEKYSPEKV